MSIYTIKEFIPAVEQYFKLLMVHFLNRIHDSQICILYLPFNVPSIHILTFIALKNMKGH